MKKYTIGIDIGGTNTVIGFVSSDGEVFAKTSLLTKNYDKGDVFVNDIAAAIRNEQIKYPDFELHGIGVCAPNANFLSGCIEENTANLRIKELIPICEILEKQLNTKVVLSNDADAAALGEHIFGGAKDCDNFVMVTLGTGVGSGFFANGRLVHGENCMAGELGHITIIPNGRDCSCGRKGCLETYTSARGICQTFRELAEIHKSEIPDNIDIQNITSQQIGDLANQGNKIALQTFDKTAEYLSVGLATATAFSNPKYIFLMGGPTKVGAPLFVPLKRYFDKNLLYIYKNRVSIEKSKLDSNNAAILGAAALLELRM